VSQVLPLDNDVRAYAWGSTEFIQTMLGREITGEPAAELWIGTHPTAPSQVATSGRSLAEVIATDPEGLLGRDVVRRFGPDLPFLLKVLAAAEPLSIQAHPTLEQAAAGYAAENERCVPLGASHRNYPDPNHKPELICALTTFKALCGFRPVEETAEFFRALVAHGAVSLAPLIDRLLATDGLRDVVTSMLCMPTGDHADLHENLLPAAARLADEGERWCDEAALVGRLAALYPNDSVVLVSLLMNYVVLEPGEAIFLSAGRIHAYIEGAGVEIMASSDNVLRSGLTPKNVDVVELLRILDFSTESTVRLRPVGTGGRKDYPVPIQDFFLTSWQLQDSSADLADDGASVLLCTDGTVLVTSEQDELVLQRGAAAFVPASTRLTISGTGQVFFARTNLAIGPPDAV